MSINNQKENHYSILNLKQDCTHQDIKNAFIQLSKKYHPDRTSDKSCHAKFVKVNEAYTILNKPASRRLYDQHLVNNADRDYHHYYDNVYTTRNDPTFWAQRARGEGFGQEPYYGIKGMKKVPNYMIVLVCFAFAAVGLAVEGLAMKKSFTFDRERLRHDSARNQIFWEEARIRAMNNGNEKQIQSLQENKLKGKNLREANEEYRKRLVDQNESPTDDSTIPTGPK